MNQQSESKVSKFNVFAFGMGEFGRSMLQTLLSMFMLFYLVNYAGISATAVGIIILVARIWDAINDPVMGCIVDNTNTKLGKARPYILYCCVPAVLLTYMVFAVPGGLSPTVKVVWVAVGYILGGTFLTAVDVPYNTLMVRITDSPLDRLSLARSKMIFNICGFMLPVMLVNSYTLSASDPGSAYTRIVGILSVVIILSYLTVFKGTREIIKTDQKNTLKFKEGLSVLKENKSWLKLVSILTLYQVQYCMFTGVLLFYLTSYFKKPEMLTNIMLIILVGMTISSAISKSLSRKFGKRNVLVGGLIMAALGLSIRIVTGDPSLTVFIVSSLLYGIGASMCTLSVPPMIADTIDYGEVKFGTRVESLSYAGLTFGTKAGTGISTAIVGVMLDKAGYVKGVVEQDPAVIKAMFAASAILPALIIVIMAIIGISYKLDKQMPVLSKQPENNVLL